MLLFANHPHVAFTNNRAERDLRMSKVKQKVSGCFRTRRYAEAHCRISSYLQSMANQGCNFAKGGGIGEAAFDLLGVCLVRVSTEESFQSAEARHGEVFPLDSKITPKAVEVGIAKLRLPQTFQDL